MKALKSTFASPDADFHQRASSDELRDTHRPVLGSFFDVTNPMEAAETAAPASVGDARNRKSPPRTDSRSERPPRPSGCERPFEQPLPWRLGGRVENRWRDGPGTGKRLCGGGSEPRRGTKPMGEMERPSPGHGGRANQTRRQMKALKSTFTSSRCTSLPNAHRGTNRGKRTGWSSDRSLGALRTDDGRHRSDPMAPAHGFRRGIVARRRA